MSKLSIIENQKLCTGCMACYNICPHNAIDIIENEEGFKYPFKNTKCINCGLCEKIRCIGSFISLLRKIIFFLITV